MFGLDPITKKELARFLIPTALGCLSYVMATLAARFCSAAQRRVYMGRLAFLALFVLLIWVFYFPAAAPFFQGPRERYFELGGDARGMGLVYGMHTTWIWCILAILRRPKTRDKTTA